ncbi:MFS transporter [Tunturibacter empetritectus]|uniref:MFS family permease n=1 Tax=Tunturiibacter lichenicola TaxID=2051959 RepID=A0A7W8J428_9BACT|nr:MFS transporter [Edaphobacter lichenicola]MBB5342172.1 MFS family permease [Edaphobacter lichenicola]
MSTTANPAAAQQNPVIDPELPAPLSMRDVLRVPMMRRLWYAQIISVFGDFLALFAVINVITFRLHATAQQVTGVQIAYMLPIAVLGILAGVFVDRWPLKPTMVSSDSIRACLCLLLIFATQIWHYYAILAAISVISSFFGPAQGVAIRSAVPLHGLRSANALMQQVMFGMRIIGPAIAGLMVSYLGAVSCYAFDSASFVGSAMLIASVTFMAVGPKAAAPTPDTANSSAIGKVWLDMKQGFNFILHHAALLFVILAMAAGMFVLGCFGPLIAIYVRDSLHASTKSFAIASAMIGLGMLLGINGLNTFGKKLKDTLLVYSGLCGIAVGLVILTLLPHLWSTILGNLTIGFSVAGIIVPSQTLFQKATPPELMGRVGSTFMSIIFTAQISGLVLSGFLSQYIGVRQVFALCAAMLVVLIVAGKIWMEPKPAATQSA